jgi:hypothetical protein
MAREKMAQHPEAFAGGNVVHGEYDAYTFQSWNMMQQRCNNPKRSNYAAYGGRGITICDRWDVGGLRTALLADTGAATIIIYDGYPGGAGIAELG